MKNDYITLICLLLVAAECMDFDSNFDNLKVNMKKIQKKQPENQEPPKEAPKQPQTGKSQKELLEEQLQQIQKYTPTNITVEGGRVFTQHEDLSEEEEFQEGDEVLLAIKQIDPDAQFDGIEFIFKKRQLDLKRMTTLLTMIDNGEIEISFKQIRQLIKKYQFENVYQKAIEPLNIDEPQGEPEEEILPEPIFPEENDEFEDETIVQDDNLSFDDLIDFDNDEIQAAKYEENVQDDENFIFDEPDIDSFDDIQYQEEMVPYEEQQIPQLLPEYSVDEESAEEEQVNEEIPSHEELGYNSFEENEEEMDYFEELRELEYFEEEHEEEIQDQPLESDKQLEQIATNNLIEISSSSDNILSKEEQNKTYLDDESFSELEFNFQENPDQVKFQKEFDLVQKTPEANLTALQAQFNLSEESLESINQKYELMDQQFNLVPETSPNPSFIVQPQFIQLSQEEEKPKFLQNYNSSIDEVPTNLNESNLLQLEYPLEDGQSTEEPQKSLNQIEDTYLNQNNYLTVNQDEHQIEQEDEEQQNIEQISEKEQEQEQKKNDGQETQSTKSNIKQTTSKPAQPHELIMSNPSSEIIEKSEEEIAKEKELKAKARYAKRYQALDIENESNKKKEEEETHYVKVDQNIDDIFIIQSLASTKKNNVVEMKDLKEEPQTLTSESDDKINIEIYNSNSEEHPQKNHKTQHFVEAFVQDMSLKSYTCDPKYFGPNKEARQFACECSNKIFLLDEESWYLAGSIQFYKQYEKIFEQIKKSIPQVYVGTSKEKVCFSSQSHQPIILNDFLKEMFLKTKIQNNFITIPNVLSLSYVQMEFSENKVKNFIMEVESNDEIKLNLGFNIKRIDMRLAQEDLHIQYIGSFLTHQQQIPFRLTNEYGKLKIDTMEVTVQLPQDEQICLQICSQILSGDVARQLQAFLNFKKGQYYITVKVLSSNESFEIFYSIRS